MELVGRLRSFFRRIAVAKGSSHTFRTMENQKKEKAKRGRIPLYKKLPLTELVDRFLSSGHGGADRSRATVSYEMSTTMRATKSFVDEGVRRYCRATGAPIPQSLPSALTLRRIGLPPDKKNEVLCILQISHSFQKSAEECQPLEGSC